MPVPVVLLYNIKIRHFLLLPSSLLL
ncbi:MAG: DUF1435 family protein [Lachnospiraceae bacterium]|nr:DUF1435 family protein [Lachnospiraceae bacterium]